MGQDLSGALGGVIDGNVINTLPGKPETGISELLGFDF